MNAMKRHFPVTYAAVRDMVETSMTMRGYIADRLNRAAKVRSDATRPALSSPSLVICATWQMQLAAVAVRDARNARINQLAAAVAVRRDEDFHGDSASVERTHYGFTVYRTTPGGYRWAESTFDSREYADARAARINADREEGPAH